MLSFVEFVRLLNFQRMVQPNVHHCASWNKELFFNFPTIVFNTRRKCHCILRTCAPIIRGTARTRLRMLRMSKIN